VALGVKVTEQDPLARVQDGALSVPQPLPGPHPMIVPTAVKPTDPVGVLEVPVEVSVTVAVQVEP